MVDTAYERKYGDVFAVGFETESYRITGEWMQRVWMIDCFQQSELKLDSLCLFRRGFSFRPPRELHFRAQETKTFLALRPCVCLDL